MWLLSQTLCLCLGLALSHVVPLDQDVMIAEPLKTPSEGHAHPVKHGAGPDRCKGIEFDAVVTDEKGTPLFFKGDHMWRSFEGPSELLNGSFQEIHNHRHPGHVDAAFRMHYKDDPEDHDHIFLLLDDKVFKYEGHTLEKGYPKHIKDEFPGMPCHLDAAVECPKGECEADSVIFFKGGKVYQYDIKAKKVEEKEWAELPNCTAAFRWLEHYYCFHEHVFYKFNPVNGSVPAKRPKDIWDYFANCSFGYSSDLTDRERCSTEPLDAMTIYKIGRALAFRGKFYLRMDSNEDTIHAFPIVSAWKELRDTVDAAFFRDNKLYFVEGDRVYVYGSEEHTTLLEGYPKQLKDELGIEGPVNDAFVCKDPRILYIIQGRKMLEVDLSATPRAVLREYPLHLRKIDAVTCTPMGVAIQVDSRFYEYKTPQELASSESLPPNSMSSRQFLGCNEAVEDSPTKLQPLSSR